jgi:hypothetical protein
LRCLRPGRENLASFRAAAGPAAVAAECNRRFRAHLKVLVDARTASDVLRRLAKEGEIQLVQKGKAHHQALYKRRPGAS